MANKGNKWLEVNADSNLLQKGKQKEKKRKKKENYLMQKLFFHRFVPYFQPFFFPHFFLLFFFLILNHPYWLMAAACGFGFLLQPFSLDHIRESLAKSYSLFRSKCVRPFGCWQTQIDSVSLDYFSFFSSFSLYSPSNIDAHRH